MARLIVIKVTRKPKNKKAKRKLHQSERVNILNEDTKESEKTN